MARSLRVAAGFVLSLFVLLSGPIAAQDQGPEPAPVAAVRAELDGLYEDISTSLAPGQIRTRLSRSFTENGIEFSQRYLDSWSTLLEDRWGQYELFFSTQSEVLTDWALALSDGAVGEDAAQTALEQALDRVRVVAEAMPDWQRDDVVRLTDRAAWTDLAQEVGCCDALYYYALDEADNVWAASASPDPLAIAALQLVPTPDIPGFPESDPAGSAYTWLAARAQGLEQLGEGDAAERHALLVEAELLVRLFGLPDGAELPRGLNLIAVEESLAARPVAPLLRLAALTERGRLRDSLLTRASERLQAQAAFFDTLPPVEGPVVVPTPAGVPVAQDEAVSAAPAQAGRFVDPAEGAAVATAASPAPQALHAPNVVADAPATVLPRLPAGNSTVEDGLEQLIASLGSENVDSAALMQFADAAETLEANLSPGDTLGMLRGLGTLPEAPATNFRTMQATGN